MKLQNQNPDLDWPLAVNIRRQKCLNVFIFAINGNKDSRECKFTTNAHTTFARSVEYRLPFQSELAALSI
jgi:hypothetical protein